MTQSEARSQHLLAVATCSAFNTKLMYHSLFLSYANRLFELEPRTKEVFGFARDYDPKDDKEFKEFYLIHAIRMIDMFDIALNMLGPDTETLNEILSDLGKRHIKYGVLPHFFPFMGHAVVYALKESIGETMTPEVTEAWVEVYAELSGTIMKAILNHS